MGYQKGHYGKYTGNARCCMDHAHTHVTGHNYKAAERDDAAHIDDEKHISKLAGDMKYDKKHHS